MLSTTKDERAAEIVPLLVADVFHLAGEFRNLGERIAGEVGQTQARWQALSVVSDGPRTVAEMARRLGYARQSVQRTADQLVDQGLATYLPNPEHKTSPLVQISDRGKRVLARLTRAGEKWHSQVAAQVDAKELNVALRVLRRLRAALESESECK